MITKKTEYFDLVDEKWVDLPELALETCSSSLFEYLNGDKRYLFCIAGLNRKQGNEV